MYIVAAVWGEVRFVSHQFKPLEERNQDEHDPNSNKSCHLAPLRCENKASFERQSYRHMLACWHGLAVMCMLGENDLKMSHWQLTCLFGQGPEKRTRRFHADEFVTIFAPSLDHILTGLDISLFLMLSPTAMLCHCALSLTCITFKVWLSTEYCVYLRPCSLDHGQTWDMRAASSGFNRWELR